LSHGSIRKRRTYYELRSVIASGLPTSSQYAPFDGKHFPHRGLAIPRHDKTLTNQALQALPFSFIEGLAGLDNMQPAVPGYSVIADVVLAALGSALRIDKDAAYDAGTLLNRLLPGLRMLIFDSELALVGSLGVVRAGSAAATV
jgi:hypothetical protein